MEMAMRYVTICLLTFNPSIGIAQANGDVYRYTDDKGQVHFTDRWRPGAELVKSGTGQSRPSASSNNTANNDQTRISDQLAAARTAQAVRQDVESKRAEQCKEATARYEKAIAARRIFKDDEQGKRTFLSDAEADQTRLEARQARDLACGPAKR